MSTDRVVEGYDFMERRTEVGTLLKQLGDISEQVYVWLSSREPSDSEQMLLDSALSSLEDAMNDLRQYPAWTDDEETIDELAYDPDPQGPYLSLNEALLKAASLQSQHDYGTDEHEWLDKMFSHVNNARICYSNYLVAKQLTERESSPIDAD